MKPLGNTEIKLLRLTEATLRTDVAIDNRVHTIHDQERNFTISYVITEASNNTVRFNAALSLVNTKMGDTFNRKRGRLNAARRLASRGRRLDRGQMDINRLFDGEVECEYPTNQYEWRALERQIVSKMYSQLPNSVRRSHSIHA